MTDAERQARHRAARVTGAPLIRTRRPTDRRSRARRWHDAVAELTDLQAQYAAWLAALPTNLQDSVIADALAASALAPRAAMSAASLALSSLARS